MYKHHNGIHFLIKLFTKKVNKLFQNVKLLLYWIDKEKKNRYIDNTVLYNQ